MRAGEREKKELLRSRGLLQTVYDFLGAPLRMVVLPDDWSRRLGLSSLEDERLRAILPVIRGRVLDIGAGNNRLVRLHEDGVGVDIHDWGGGALVVEETRRLPFAAGEFDTVTFVASLNHIPYRDEVLCEAHRVLKPGGRLVVTMIGPWIGSIGHRLWWYSEDKRRHVNEHELMGMSRGHVIRLIAEAGFRNIGHTRFLYRLNHLFTAIA